ncbi:MAG TPA: Ig-like domain-containing protein, partial [Candidatus Limnocylindria bacterium]|nr:Ig-like domain-containing protein [Candidatus Limnocylindria bacterium]
PFNCDLVVYKDLRQVQAKLLADAATQEGIRLSLSGDIMADDLDADDLDADDLDADDLDADDLDADDLDADDLDAAESSTYVAAQRKGLRAASLTPGLANETVVLNTRDLTGDLYIRVAGGSSLSGIFTINARRTTDASCLTAPLVSRQPSTTFGAAAVGKRSLILTDTGARGYALDAASRAAFLSTLGTFASHPTVQGQVVDLADDAGIQQLRADWASARTCVAQANLVTDAIREVVQRFKTATGGSFEYLVNAGGDSVIPFRRVADWAEISRESRYNPPLAALTASEASLISDTFLNDDFYVASPIDGPNRTLYLPEAAVGRLVESVADVTAYIAMYLAADGVAAPTSALSSGYDFNLDLANYVTSQLSLRGLAVDSSLVSNTWSSADWRAKVLERAVTDAFGILSLQGHFSANRLVPADNGQRVLSSELAAITDGRFLKALVYSLGCHSGYSIVDADGTILTQVDAFPEVFVRKGATVVAGTGYQYGETILMKNTEALIALLTDELGYSTSPTGASYAAGVPIGKALMQAKRAYMAQTATPRGIDLKVVGVSTVYGSPTMAFRLPSQQARPGSGTLAPAPVSGFAGLTALDVATSDSLTPVTSGGGTYYTANGATTTAPYRPIAPLSTIDANVAGSVLQGAVFLGGAYTETAGFTPRLSIPATELAGDAPRYANDVFMPVIPVRTNLFDGDALQVVPFQYRSNADGTSGTARVFGGGVQVRAFWSSVTGPSAAADAPAIRDVLLDLDSQGRLVVVATLRGVLDPGIAEVWLTYTDATAAARSFASVAMVPVAGAPGNIVPDAFGQGFTRLYTATLSGDPAKYRFLLQAVSGNGRVSAATNNGELYRFVPVSLRPTPPAPTVDTRVASALALSAPSSATYRSTITATVTLTGAGQALGGKTVTFAFGGSTRSAVTGTNGVATATLDVNVTPRSAPYTLTASFAGDTTAHGSSASANVTVGRAPTLLQAITASPQYSDGAAVARLTSGGLTLNEQAVVITRGAVSVATFTDFAGDVRFDTIDFGAGAGTSTLTIEYPGNDRYGPSSLTADVPVLRENATLALTQPGPQPTGAITFTAQVAQAADGSLGDLRRATVDFTFTPASGSPVSASSAADASGGASVTVTLPAGLYEVTAQVTGDFTSEVVAIAVPVYDASAFVSGGGYLTTGTDSLGVPLGVRANFGFVAEYGVDGTTATGDLNLHVKSRTGKDNDTDAQARANGSLKFKATSFEWLVIAGNGAAFTGTGTVNGVAGYQFRADVVDDGSSDLFVIHIWDADSTYAAPDHIVRGTLGGGNIRIHR